MLEERGGVRWLDLILRHGVDLANTPPSPAQTARHRPQAEAPRQIRSLVKLAVFVRFATLRKRFHNLADERWIWLSRLSHHGRRAGIPVRPSPPSEVRMDWDEQATMSSVCALGVWPPERTGNRTTARVRRFGVPRTNSFQIMAWDGPSGSHRWHQAIGN